MGAPGQFDLPNVPDVSPVFRFHFFILDKLWMLMIATIVFFSLSFTASSLLSQ
jgi:hypothetical protein